MIEWDVILTFIADSVSCNALKQFVIVPLDAIADEVKECAQKATQPNARKRASAANASSAPPPAA